MAEVQAVWRKLLDSYSYLNRHFGNAVHLAGTDNLEHTYQ
jgi:hypothetical protein